MGNPTTTDDLIRFIEASPSPYHAAGEATRRLVAAGFTQSPWGAPFPAEGPVVVRHEGFVAAWCRRGQAADAPLRIVGAHTDSPNLRVRPQPDRSVAGWQQLGVEVYGGALLNSWLDRDLGLSGRVAIAQPVATDDPASDHPTSREGIAMREVRWDEPLLRVPQLAIHLDREIHTDGLKLNAQQHLTPVWGIAHGGGAPAPTSVGAAADDAGFKGWLAEELEVDPSLILAWDLMTHDLTPPALLGRRRELLAAPRLDNLCSAWAGVTAMVQAASSPAASDAATVPMLILADHEEVGSTSGVGAASAAIVRLVEAVILSADEGAAATPGGPAVGAAMAGTVIASADMAHATHPNYVDRHEPGHHIAPGAGPALKVNSNQRYASDARTAALLQRAAAGAGVNLQTYSHRGDLPCGSTIGPTLAASLGVGVVDVGAPQLSMHSARELMAVDDIQPLARLLASWLGC